jgi:hypothetical protein
MDDFRPGGKYSSGKAATAANPECAAVAGNPEIVKASEVLAELQVSEHSADKI